MVTTRRSANANADQAGVALRAVVAQRQQRRQDTARQRREAAAESRASTVGGAAITGIYRDMLIEAGVQSPAGWRNGQSNSNDSTEPPAKKLKRPGHKRLALMRHHDSDDDDAEFEDIAIPEPVIQTREMDSEDDEDSEEEEEEEEDGQVFADVSFPEMSAPVVASGSSSLPAALASAEPEQTLELNLSVHDMAVEILRSRIGRGVRGSKLGKVPTNRKKPLTKAERMRRVEIHKMHVLCLMAHAARRNSWCNSPKVQAALRPLLTDKLISYLNPGSNLSQFGQTESLKNGLQQIAVKFKTRFGITERGLRRSLWAETPDQLTDYELPNDLESVLDKDDFIEAAKMLQGSRDIGAQLFCALLRAAGVETRLVCSLQPLSILTNAPTMPKGKALPGKTKRNYPIPSIYQSPQKGNDSDLATDPFASPLSRLGHPDAAGYNVPSVTSPSPRKNASSSSSSPHIVRGESQFPVYWVEVLDVAHQKWQPVDPLVTGTQWRPQKLEPPGADRFNHMCYVIGFNENGEAKDVTRRYAKAYNAKTKRSRVDGAIEPASALTAVAAAAVASLASPGTGSPASPAPMSGTKWLRRTIRYFRETYPTDLDQIEDRELGVLESREPIPRNVADFQNHPVYSLERHLRRHEVLVPNATSVGTISAGNKAPLERIYRRRDVRVAYSVDRWYRLGRVVRPGEIPVKWLPKPVSRRRGLGDDDDYGREKAHSGIAPPVEIGVAKNEEDDDDLFADKELEDIPRRIAQSHPIPNGVPLFIPEQTDLYQAPPVEDGRIPKNKFGNIDIYVPSMVPQGGEYIHDDTAGRAAFILGVDYAPALTGFKFEGRQGTAVLRGAVVAQENSEAVRAVIEGLVDLQAEIAEQRRIKAALRMWSIFLRGLRIRARIRAAAEDRGEDVDDEEVYNDEDEEEQEQEEEEKEGEGDTQDDELEEEGPEHEEGDRPDDEEDDDAEPEVDADTEAAIRAEVEAEVEAELEAEEAARQVTAEDTSKGVAASTEADHTTVKPAGEPKATVTQDGDEDLDEAEGDIDDAKSDVTEEFDMVMDDDDDYGGGFMVDDDEDFGGGGFIPE